MIDLWNKEESDTNKLLMDFMDQTKEWGLDCNGDELVRTIHSLQMFVWQHALQRNSAICGEWYSKLPRSERG